MIGLILQILCIKPIAYERKGNDTKLFKSFKASSKYSILILVVSIFNFRCDLNTSISANFNSDAPAPNTDTQPIPPPIVPPPPPDPAIEFDFTDLTGLQILTMAESDIIELTGIFSNESISISGQGEAPPWSLSDISQSSPSILSVLSEDNDPISFKFSADGTKMFMLGQTTNSIYQYSMTTAYDLYTASYDGITLPVGGQDTSPYSIAFSSDGATMFMLGSTSDMVHQYALSTGFDLSSASYSSLSYSVNSEDSSPRTLTFNSDGSKMYFAGDSTDSVYEYTLPTSFDITVVNYFGVSMNSVELSPRSLTFNDDGSKMFILGVGTKDVFEYNLSTVYDLSTAIYSKVRMATLPYGKLVSEMTFPPSGNKLILLDRVSQEFREVGLSAPYELSIFPYRYINGDLSTPATKPKQISFNNDGTKGFILGADTDAVYEYSMSPPYSIENLVYTSNFLSVNPEMLDPRSMTFNDDGSRLFVLDRASDDVFQYNLSTPFQISSASYSLKSYNGTSEDTDPNSINFNSDGTKMYILGSAGDKIHQYTLTTPYDLSMVAYNNVFFSFTSEDNTPRSIVFDDIGLKLYMTGNATDSIFEYSLTSPFDIATLSFKSIVYRFSNLDSSPDHLEFNSDGSKLFVTGTATNSVYELNLINNYAFPEPEFDRSVTSLSAEDFLPQGLIFSNDGFKMFMVGDTNNSIFEYTLSSAFDPKSATYNSVNFPIGAQDTSPRAIAFNNLGTKLYLIGNSSDSVHEYSLSQAFDLSSLSFTASFSIALEDGTPEDIIFNDDGGKMYVLGAATDSVYEYTLTVNFDVLSAGYTSVHSLASADSQPRSIKFNGGGTELFYIGSAYETIFQFSLSPAYDISSISSFHSSFSIANESLSPNGIIFNNDGSKMFILDEGTVSIYSYESGQGGRPEYRICSDSLCSLELFNWRSDGTGVVNSGNYIQLRSHSSSSVGLTNEISLQIGTNILDVDWLVSTQP